MLLASNNDANISMSLSFVEIIVLSFLFFVNFVLTSVSFMFLFLLYAIIGWFGKRVFKVSSFSSSSQYFARLSFKSFVLIYGLYVVVKIGSFLCCSCILC